MLHRWIVFADVWRGCVEWCASFVRSLIGHLPPDVSVLVLLLSLVANLHLPHRQPLVPGGWRLLRAATCGRSFRRRPRRPRTLGPRDDLPLTPALEAPPASIEHDDTCQNQLRGTHTESDWGCLPKIETHVPLDRLQKVFTAQRSQSARSSCRNRPRSRHPRLPALARKSLSTRTHVWQSRGCTWPDRPVHFAHDRAACRCSFLSADTQSQDACVVTMFTVQDFCAKSNFHETLGPLQRQWSTSKGLRPTGSQVTPRIAKHLAVSAIPEMTKQCWPFRSLLENLASRTPKICARTSCASTKGHALQISWTPLVLLCLEPPAPCSMKLPRLGVPAPVRRLSKTTLARATIRVSLVTTWSSPASTLTRTWAQPQPIDQKEPSSGLSWPRRLQPHFTGLHRVWHGQAQL